MSIKLKSYNSYDYFFNKTFTDKLYENFMDKHIIYHNEPYEGPLKCRCGTTITMGKDDDIQFHSDFCDLKTGIKTK